MQNEFQQSAGFGSLLASLAKRINVENIWFNNQTVTLDGYYFHQCRFDACKLNISSTNFEIHRCFIDEDTEIYFDGEMIKILKLFHHDSEWMYKHFPKFTPSRHDDGTISITI